MPLFDGCQGFLLTAPGKLVHRLTADVKTFRDELGMTAEFVAERFNISREAMDEFAWCSQQKALAAIKEGHFTSQVLPLEVREGKNSRLFAIDEHPRDT